MRGGETSARHREGGERVVSSRFGEWERDGLQGAKSRICWARLVHFVFWAGHAANSQPGQRSECRSVERWKRAIARMLRVNDNTSDVDCSWTRLNCAS